MEAHSVDGALIQSKDEISPEMRYEVCLEVLSSALLETDNSLAYYQGRRLDVPEALRRSLALRTSRP